MNWNPKGLIIAIIASVVKFKLPMEAALHWSGFIDVISAALSDIELSDPTPKEMYEKKFEKCLEDLLLSPSSKFEIGDRLSEIIEDFAALDFQFDNNFSKDIALNNIRKVLSKHNVYVANIDDKTLDELAHSIYVNLENAVQENVQSLSYYILKRLCIIENKINHHTESRYVIFKNYLPIGITKTRNHVLHDFDFSICRFFVTKLVFFFGHSAKVLFLCLLRGKN